MSTIETASGGSLLRSTKIRPCHLEKLAIVYVRQSSSHQILDHRESRDRQYALSDHAVALGWAKDRVVTIDEDQGQTGKTAQHRSGFHRLLSEVTMDHVGIVLSLEMSRLARCCKDWHHLLEVAGVFGTLLGDQDGVYDAYDVNDRLLLGLKGTMSEFELVTMRNRLERGRLHKAERGELFHSVPFGYVKLSTGQVEQDPDEQVRAVVQLIFDKFSELGSVHAVFRYLIANDITVGMRAAGGPRRGNVEWRRPALPTLQGMLRNPIYAGAYAYGRRVVDRKATGCDASRVVTRTMSLEQLKVLKKDILPGYISWDRYQANLQRLRENRPMLTAKGPIRRGTALLSGLVICGTCGRRRCTSYGKRSSGSYECRWHQKAGRERTCFTVQAAPVDELLTQQVLCALEPAGVQVSLNALRNIQQERERLDRHWQRQLERARYEAERIERQYQAVEPENRLVARSLEQRWEESLRKLRQLKDDYDRFARSLPRSLSELERAKIIALSKDIPALWKASGTTLADHKEIIRCLVDRVVVSVPKESERVEVTIHWHGGFSTQHQIVRSVACFEYLHDFGRLMDRVVALRSQGHTARQIATQLNEEGFHSPLRSKAFSPAAVRQLLSRRGLSTERIAAVELERHEWWLPELAKKLVMSRGRLAEWARRGWLHSRRSPGQGLWVLWADTDEIRRLRKLATLSSRAGTEYHSALTTPKKRPTTTQAKKL